jgi:hypothetical protein
MHLECLQIKSLPIVPVINDRKELIGTVMLTDYMGVGEKLNGDISTAIYP